MKMLFLALLTISSTAQAQQAPAPVDDKVEKPRLGAQCSDQDDRCWAQKSDFSSRSGTGSGVIMNQVPSEKNTNSGTRNFNSEFK